MVLKEMNDVCETGTTFDNASRVLTTTSSSWKCDTETQSMAFKFGEWFYSMLNSASSPSSTFNQSHFWPDCRMMQRSNTDGDVSFVGSEDVAKHLWNLIATHSLLFNPNLTNESVTVNSDPHGLMSFNLCGTLMQSNVCIGTFDQSFGLIRDPMAENAWKIKFTNLLLRVSQNNRTSDAVSYNDQQMIG